MSDFDPRFDPAFQRGYDGPEASPTVRASVPVDASAEATTPVVRSVPRVDPAAQAAPTPRFAPPADDPTEDLPPRRANPFLVVLAAIAVLFTAGGLALVFQLRTIFADGQSSADFDYITLQTLMIGAPILVGLGLATGLGVLFVFAVRWGRGPVAD